jgi:hypothetical protein
VDTIVEQDINLGARHSGMYGNGFYTLLFELAYLIFHQGDQWRDYYAKSIQ